MVSVKLPAKDKQETLKPNTFLNLANALETIPQDLFLCDFITVLGRFEKYSLSLRRYSTSKVPNLFFAKSLIDTIYIPVVIYIS